MIFTPAATRSSASGCAAGGRDREDADDDVLLRHDPRHVVVGADGQAVAHRVADLVGIVVEDRHDAEAVVGEDVRPGDRAAQVAGAEQRDVVLPAGAQDLADLRDQRVDVVAHAALAELAEAGQIAADLRRVDVGVVGELLRRDRVLAHLLGLGEDLEVARQAGGDAERQALAVALDQAGRRPRSRSGKLTAPMYRGAVGAPRGSTWYSNSSSPVDRDHRDALAVLAVEARDRATRRPPRGRTAARPAPRRAPPWPRRTGSSRPCRRA